MPAITPMAQSGSNYTNLCQDFFINKVPFELVQVILLSMPNMDALSISLSRLAATCTSLRNNINADGTRKKISSVFLKYNNMTTSKDLKCIDKIVDKENGCFELLDQVQHLDFSNSGIGNEELQDILNHCMNLVSLNLGGCVSLSSLRFPNHTKLLEVDLEGCTNLAMADLGLPDSVIIKNRPQLTALDLALHETLQQFQLQGLMNPANMVHLLNGGV